MPAADMQALPPPDPPQQAIVVTGRALPRVRSERLSQSETVSADEVRRAPSQQLDRLLERFAGVQLFRRSDARSAHPTSQGVTLRGLGGNAASRVQLVLDGVPQSDPFGGWVAWPAFGTSDLAEVRVTRGGGSVVNGPGSLGGTIELTGATGESFGAALHRGSRNSLETHALVREEIGAGFVAASLHGGRGEGFIPVVASSRGAADRAAPYRNAGGRLRGVAPLGGSTELQASLSGFIDERERGLRYTANRSRGGDASLRIVSRDDWAWTILAYGQVRNFRSSFAATDGARSEARRASLQYDVPARSAGWSVELRPPVETNTELRIGADGRSMRGQSRELASYSAGMPQRQREAGGQSGFTGLFGEISRRDGPLLITGAARIDRWSISDGQLTERSTLTGAMQSEADYNDRKGWRPTGRVAGALELRRQVTIRSAAYLGWRLPTLNELFRPFRAGADATAANAGLRPERLRGIEAGLDWKADLAGLSITAFANRLQDAIANVSLGSGPGVFPGVGFVAPGGAYRQRQNIDAVQIRGLEVAARWQSGPWSAALSASFTDAKVEASGAAQALNGLSPAQTPRLTSAASLSWESARRSATLVARFEGPRFEDDLNRQRLDSALTFDAAVAMPLTGELALVARAENALDARIAAAITGDGIVERATPRTLWLGLRFQRESPR